MATKTPRIGYAGIGAYVPERVLTNEHLTRIVDTSDEWITRRTGIRKRRILAEGESVLDMAVHASRQALEDAGVEPGEIGDIRVGVNTWMRFPSLATQLQKELGADRASAADVSAGCAGFVYAVEEAYNKLLVERMCYGRDLTALVVGVDGLSHITNWTDRSTCVLLGDGAGAVVLKSVERGEILAIHTHADGRHGHLLYSDPVLTHQNNGTPQLFSHKAEGQRPYLHMDGRRVYAIACETMARDARTVIEKHNAVSGESIGVEDIAYVYPHQANMRIIETVAKKLGLPLERVYHQGIREYGNTSTASIPIGYVDNRAQYGNGKPERLEIDVAIGAGFASGAILRRAV